MSEPVASTDVDAKVFVCMFANLSVVGDDRVVINVDRRLASEPVDLRPWLSFDRTIHGHRIAFGHFVHRLPVAGEFRWS